MRILLFAAAFVIACCLTARAAVVEGDQVQRQVDGPAGVRVQTGLGEPSASPAAAETPLTGPGSSGPAPEASPSRQAPAADPAFPTTAPTPAAAPTGSDNHLLGPLLVGLIVIALGVFVILAKSRGRR